MSEIAVIGDYDVRDRKLADAGTGTSVASTDAVVLKDTNGNYVEIDRDSFTDAIRSALGPILTNMTQKTAASGGVVVNDSNDVGTMNLSNLASVLGAIVEKTGYGISDADNVINAVAAIGSGQHLPTEQAALICAFGSSQQLQLGLKWNGELYYRWNWSGKWSEWIKLN